MTTPSIPATNIYFTNIELNQADILWTNGNGAGRVVFMMEGDNGTVEPVNNTTYAANNIFGSGDQTGSGGWYCMYNGTSNNVTVTGLSPNTTYRVMVCEYNGSTGNEKYNTSDATGNPASFSTLLTNIERNKESQPLQFHIYPNPFSDNITWKMPE